MNYDVAIKLRPCGGLIGKDNSLDKYLNDSKILRMHAILHDATGFEETETLPFIRMLKERSVVLDFEGFRHQKKHIYSKRFSYNHFRLQCFPNFSTSS